MVLQKRLDYGFNGYQAPHVPRATRSARRRCLFKSKAVNQQVCAFDLLATVAGKLLSEGENSPPSVGTSSGKEQPSVVEDPICKEENKENKPIEESICHERKFIYTELVSEAPSSKFRLNELPCAQNGVSEITTSYGSEKNYSAEKLELQLGIASSTKHVESEDEDRKKQAKVDYNNNVTNLSIGNRGYVEVWNRKPSSALASVVNNSVKFPDCGDHSPCGSFPVHQENVKLVNTDDNDEKSSECNENGTINKAFGPPHRVVDRRSRKILASKHYKATPNMEDEEHYNADTKRCNYVDRKESLKRQRSIRDYPFKKRKLYEFSSVSRSDEGISSDQICNFHENGTGTNGGVLHSGLAQPGVRPTPTSARGESTSFHSRDHKVKLKIKSFRVPELFIEIPETASVGSLKRTVMEAVNAVLGGGLRVGVILQGKKIRDDNRTLLQTGISHNNKMDTLGFALEPSPVQSQNGLRHEDQPVGLLHDSPQPLSRYPPTPSITWNSVHQGSVEAPPNYSGTTNNFNNFMENDQDSAASLHEMPTASESKALVSVTAMKLDPLAMVPMRKSKRSESAQRRIRRPFAVAEVEALVQAVEKLGTGRWRDVKLRAFDNAKHRTYVDLKDKWKTLVHTARISPQQRRGEPVPQELLNRVLNAHAFWSQHQAKQQHLKSQLDSCLLL